MSISELETVIIKAFPFIIMGITFWHFLSWSKAKNVTGRIIGYQFIKDSKNFFKLIDSRYFYPVFEYQEKNHTKRKAIKGLQYFAPEGRNIHLRLNADTHYTAHWIFCLGLSAISFTAYALLFYSDTIYEKELLDVTIVTTGLFFLTTTALYYALEFKTLKEVMPAYLKYRFKGKPEKFSTLGDADFERIKKSDLVSYEDARLCVYRQDKKILCPHSLC